MVIKYTSIDFVNANSHVKAKEQLRDFQARDDVESGYDVEPSYDVVPSVDWEKPLEWVIERCVYNTHNESTFALIKGPEDKTYIVVMPGHTLDPKSCKFFINQYFKQTEASKKKTVQMGWNHLIDQTEGGIPEIQKKLLALPFHEIRDGDSKEEFNEFIEYTRYIAREELAEIMGASQEDKKKFVNADLGQKNLYDKHHMYFRPDLFKGSKYERIISKEEVPKIISQICEDFDIPQIKNIVLITNSQWRNEGDYAPDLLRVRLKYMQPDGTEGVKLSTLMHEMAHHIDNYYMCDKPVAHHGHRFRRIAAYLFHNYMGIPVLDLQNPCIGPVAMKLSEDEITRRDFGLTKLYDIKIPERDAYSLKFKKIEYLNRFKNELAL